MQRLVLIFAVLIGVVALLVLGVINVSRLDRLDRPKVKVFGYGSFTNSWGPGPRLKALFEETCQCTIEFIESSDSGFILQRIKLDGPEHGPDMVIGLDQFDLEIAEGQLAWQKISLNLVPLDLDIAAAIPDSPLVPFDWGVVALVARRSELLAPLTSLDDLLRSDLINRIAIQNPASSSPGQQFLTWVIRAKGIEAAEAYLRALLQQVHSITPGWSEAYGLFTKRVVATTVSYTTSPVYHKIEEDSDDYMAMEFVEGHPVQIEFLGIPANCRQCALAQEFAALMLSAAGQKIIMEKSYMFPIRAGVAAESDIFAAVPKFKTLPLGQDLKQAQQERYLDLWSRIRRGG